ncbi:FAD-binding dehydrogenase [Cognatiyoonia sp. IB215446]|uniref:FAD-binding dehydrogenase n=1 Tax=Cognatiyoonia sp. IB215446 TaxID=3097355 RepID=UPI002A0B9573|nr:FAD-binding dehydrogenase [Cognatiyoonia sp. IB215446]MDX8349914.1 FAD-binding dehydrogenase [Cognatiyoonia sp. IB215446]
MHSDVVIIGGGLAGLVAAHELVLRGKTVTILDQEGRQNLGGQAFWSLGGLLMIDTPEQRRMRVNDSHALATNDWMGSAQFDRPEDHWPREWAKAYLDFAAGEMRPWLYSLGMRWFPIVGWAERGGSFANGHGNSIPRFHITWGTGPGVLKPFEARALEAEKARRVEFGFRHRVTGFDITNGKVAGVFGEVLAPDDAVRGAATNRDVIDRFDIRADQVIVTSGGIGGNFDLVRRNWDASKSGPLPDKMVSGVPEHVDGLLLDILKEAGGELINTDRMWHYTEGVQNWDPIWPKHGIRILPGPSSMWFDATGDRLPAPCMPGFDTMSTLHEICRRGYDHTWFVLTQKIIEKEFALSGSEQNPDLTGGTWRGVLRERLGKGATAAVEAFKEKGEDFVVANDFDTLVGGMNQLGGNLIDPAKLRAQIDARDAQIDNPFTKDAQVTAIHSARNYLGDKLIRTAKPHKILDPSNGPLIAVKLHVVTRKTLGGIHTDLDGRVFAPGSRTIDGLFAAGEAAGFGGGGYHGNNALEGTFLGGCIHSGRRAGRSAG